MSKHYDCLLLFVVVVVVAAAVLCLDLILELFVAVDWDIDLRATYLKR